MNILRLSTLSLTLAIAVVMLGVSVNAWAGPGECTGKKSDRDPDCDVDDPPQTTFTVNMEVTSVKTPIAVMCTGTTESGGGLGAGFGPEACRVSLDDETFGLHDYCLFATSVRNTNKGTRVMLFMRRDCDVVNSTGDDNYHTLQLTAELVLDLEPEGPDFYIVVDEPAVGKILTKIHQPEKNKPLDEKIFIGDIVYTEVVPP
jgi:hypothetical protein